MQIELIGVYPVISAEPCHLIELGISCFNRNMNMDAFTQILTEVDRENWQAPYDEAFLNPTGDALANKADQYTPPEGPNCRLVFYFHYLDFGEPLQTPAGPIRIPNSTPMPGRLKFLEYEAP